MQTLVLEVGFLQNFPLEKYQDFLKDTDRGSNPNSAISRKIQAVLCHLQIGINHRKVARRIKPHCGCVDRSHVREQVLYLNGELKSLQTK